MFEGILGFVILIISGTLFLVYHFSGTPGSQYLLGVELSTGVQKKPEVIALAKKYRHGNARMLLLFLIFAVPIFLLKYVSFLMIYMTVWCFAYFYLSNRYHQSYSVKLLLMKSKNLWFKVETAYHPLISQKKAEGTGNPLVRVYRSLFPSFRDRLLAQADGPVYVDNDEYWLEGSYNNPTDQNKLVDKRVGYGSTYNMAHHSGTVINVVTAIFVITLIGGLSFFFFQMDFAEFKMRIEGSTIFIDAPVYHDQFSVSDIVDVALIDSLPEGGTRTNGASTDQYDLGNFRLDGIGKAKVFIYKGYPPYLQITLRDRTVYFNSKVADQTKEYYGLLVNLIDPK